MLADAMSPAAQIGAALDYFVSGKLRVPAGYRLVGTKYGSHACFTRRKGEYTFKVTKYSRAAFDFAKPVDRCELVSLSRADYNRRYEVAYDFVVAPYKRTAAWTVLGQWHQTSDPGENTGVSPPFAIVLTPDNSIRIVIRTTNRKFSAETPSQNIIYRNLTFRSGRLYSMRFVFVWSPAGHGSITGWQDGHEIIKYSGPTGYNDKLAPYWQFGAYRSSFGEPLSVTYSNVTVRELRD